MTTIQLTAAATAEFNTFLDQFAPQYDKQEAAFELLDVITDRYMDGEALTYEVRAAHTSTGRPEEFRLDVSDLIVSEDD